MLYDMDFDIDTEIELNGTYMAVRGCGLLEYTEDGHEIRDIEIDAFDDEGNLLGHWVKREGELFAAVVAKLSKGSFLTDLIADDISASRDGWDGD
jgi:hypothetical protein